MSSPASETGSSESISTTASPSTAPLSTPGSPAMVGPTLTISGRVTSLSGTAKLCDWCKEPFQNKRAARFCGKTCAGKWLSATHQDRQPQTRTQKHCEWCGERFYRPDKTIRFCSTKCAAAWRAQHQIKHKTIDCETCGRQFHPARATTRFCSASCRATAVNKARPKKIVNSAHHLVQVETGGLPVPQYKLWRALGGRTAGWHPQFWMSPFGTLPGVTYVVADLAHLESRTIIEVDGRSHIYRQERDTQIDAWMCEQGWSVLRFSNQEVMTSIDSLVQTVREAMSGSTTSRSRVTRAS